MDYERTMKQFAQEIEKTNRKIQLYLKPQQERYQRSALKSGVATTLQHDRPTIPAPISRIQQVRYSLPQSRLTQKQVCCITVNPEPDNTVLDPLRRHKTQQSNESLASQKLSRVRSRQDEIPESNSRRISIAESTISQLPTIAAAPASSYQRTYYDSLSRQVELSRLRKQKKELSMRMEEMAYVNKGMNEFPFGHEHIKIMEKIMNKREAEDRRNEQTLLRFEKDQEEYRRQKNLAARITRDSQVQQGATSSLQTTFQGGAGFEYSYARDNMNSVVDEVSESETVDQQEEQRHRDGQLEESILTVKLDPSISVLAPSHIKPMDTFKPEATNSDQHSKLPLIEQQSLQTTQHPKISFPRKSEKVHYTLNPPKKELNKRSLEAKSSQLADKKGDDKDDMANIRRHLELLKKHRLERILKQKQRQEKDQPFAEISELLDGLHAEMKQSSSFNHHQNKPTLPIQQALN